ncbi:MAG: YqjK-like family protein [Thiobacillus sp.]|nr:YqjK-like family protein [Thiobacillus sp.]
MNKKSIRLAERRSLLIAQAEAQRTALAHNLAPWRARLALADRGIAAVRYVRNRPGLLLAAALVVAALRPRRLGTWLQRGWLAWQIRRRLFGR